jgi:transposase
MKKIFTPDQKASVAVAAIKEQQTINQISAAYEVHPTQIGLWKKQAIQGLKDVFSDKRKKENQTRDQLVSQLYQTIGQRDMELTWLKKKLEPFGSSG